MRHRISGSYDKLLLASAVAMLTTSCVWFWQQQPALRRLHGLRVRPQLEDSPYTPAALRPPEQVTDVWPEASSRPDGRGWLYDVFTPPVIYYSPVTQSFTVTPSGHPADEGTRFGLELLAVNKEQFRLQLVGYLGGPEDYLAAFASPNQPETFLVRAGRRFAALGLTLKSFAVSKVVAAHNDAGPVLEVAALAVLSDDRTGTDIILDSRKRKFTDTPLAVLKIPAAGGHLELHEGEAIFAGTSTYRVERIQLDPPEVTVARAGPDLPLPEIRILHPVGDNPRGAATNGVGPVSGRAAAGLAVNNQ